MGWKRPLNRRISGGNVNQILALHASFPVIVTTYLKRFL